MGTVNGRTYAFVGLERIGGVMICDITDPSAVTFRNYVNSRNYSADIYDDVSPEGVIFVASEPSGDAPNQDEPASPKTGDEASPVLWTAVILTTGAAMLGMAVCGRKQKRIRAE